MKPIISQCRDWCCEQRPYADRWYNVHYGQPGEYQSFPTHYEACRFTESFVRVFGEVAQ